MIVGVAYSFCSVRLVKYSGSFPSPVWFTESETATTSTPFPFVPIPGTAISAIKLIDLT